MTNRTIDALVTITPETEIEIVYQDSVDINIETPMLYIQSGKDDIENYVNNKALPELEQFIRTEAEPLVSVVINEIAEPTVVNFVEETIKPDILEYSESKKEEMQESVNIVASNTIITTEKASTAIEAAEQAKEAATSAQILSETAKQTIETETANSITTINQHSVGILSTMERYATQTQENANIAQNAVDTLPDYLGQIEATTEEGIKKLQANGAFNHAVVDALPETVDENKFYFIRE